MRLPGAVGLAFLSVAFVGCGGRSPGGRPLTTPTVSIKIGARFHPATAGEVRGRVVWDGETPALADTHAAIPVGPEGYRWTTMPVPFKPAIDPKSRGLADAVVYLQTVDPATARPWDHPPVTVLQQGYQIRVTPGRPTQSVGIVRRGDEVTFSSTDPTQHMLRARGAAYFTLPFPEPNKPLTRRLDTAGIVALSSGAGMAWMAADLFVVDHPYYAVTDTEGRFTLPKVPAGDYKLIAWVRNWHVESGDRDTETGITIRHRYAAPVEKHTPLRVTASQPVEHDFRYTIADFPSPNSPR